VNAKELVDAAMVKKGDYITTVKGKLIHPRSLLTGESSGSSFHDCSWRGDVLEVLAVDLPFVHVLNHSFVPRGHKHVLDLDSVEIAPLSNEFVASVLGLVFDNKEVLQ
jgi:hypothetical protein